MKNINNKELHEIFVKLKENHAEKNFNELYNKYQNLVYKIAFSLLKNKEDAEDIVQIVFAKIYKLDKDKLPSEYEASWLYSLTKNETLNYIKKKINTVNLDTIYYISSENNELNEIIDIDTYNNLISKLNKEEREIISLKILANLSFREIAQILKQPIGTIQWRYYKALHILKILLSNLSVFIISILMFAMKRTKKQNIHADDTLENQINDDDTYRQEESNKFDSASISNTTQEDTTTETIIVNDNKLDNYDIGILSISSIFLIFTIISFIFFIKYQQKAKKTLSK